MSTYTFCIYYFQNKINGKMYIGKATNFDNRVKEHTRSSNIDNPKYPIHKAIKKYGISNFETNIIRMYDTEEEALFAEIFWIQNLKDQGIELYNLTIGGDGISGYRHTDEQKALWSKNRKGKMAGANHPLYGKPRPDDVKKKSRDKQLGKKLSLDVRNNMSISRKGKPKTQKFIGALSESRIGDGNPNAKLDWDTVSKIRGLLNDGKITQDEIGNMFHISRTIISRIKNNKIWKI